MDENKAALMTVAFVIIAAAVGMWTENEKTKTATGQKARAGVN